MAQSIVKLVSVFTLAASAVGVAQAQDTRIALGMSGWTGFAPLTLADKAGIFKKNGLDVELKMIPQKDRHLALASGSIQCAATTVETHVAWNANGVPITQIFQMDKSYGADGIAVRNDVKSFADLKGKTVAVSAPGTAPYFGLAWMLSKNGMSMKDVKLVSLEPQPAAQAFVAGQNDAAMTYEPYLSTVRANPQAGKILATTLECISIHDIIMNQGEVMSHLKGKAGNRLCSNCCTMKSSSSPRPPPARASSMASPKNSHSKRRRPAPIASNRPISGMRSCWAMLMML